MMNTFESLTQEKQTMILNAAFSCFGKNGYKKTSVADIASAASISKASVFQYFRTKKELYFYLFEYACDKILNETPTGTDDFFECLRIGSEVKIRVMAQYPGMFDFLSSLVNESDAVIISELHERNDQWIGKGLAMLFANINWDKFKSGIDREMAVNTARWVSEGYIKSAIGRKDVDTILHELTRYLDLLKVTLYKEEYLK